MGLYEDIVARKEKISLIGLGYVGLPIAIDFSKKVDVIGFDINSEKIAMYLEGIDPTREVGNDSIEKCEVRFTCDENELKSVKFHIVAVPTPVKLDNTPDLTPLEKASATVGRNLAKGSVIVFESTVYPGTASRPSWNLGMA
jgi:UDP-N-acetyl-D-galactosamine dehydrogenase